MREANSTLNEFLQRIPKIELHCHLLGTIRKATMKELACKNGARTTDAEINAFYVRGAKPVGVLHIYRELENHILSKTLMIFAELPMNTWKTPPVSRFDTQNFSGTRQAH